MPDERREFHKIRPASHTLLSVNCLYQMNTAERKRVFTKLGRVTNFHLRADDSASRRSSEGEDRKGRKNMDHSGSRLRALSGLNRSHLTRTKLRRDGVATGDSDAESETKTAPSSPPVRLCDDATRLLATFVYLDSFEDILPRNVLFSELRPAKKATVCDRCHSFVWALDKHKIP
jgi:hypothetical protein